MPLFKGGDAEVKNTCLL